MSQELIIVDSGPLRDELIAMGFQNVTYPRDQRVLLPHVQALNDVCNWTSQNRPPYTAEKWDCDDFAFHMVTQASLALCANTEALDCGHALLYCAIQMIEGENLNGCVGAHSTNLVKCSDGVWRFFEPQNGRITDAIKALNSVVGMANLVIL